MQGLHISLLAESWANGGLVDEKGKPRGLRLDDIKTWVQIKHKWFKKEGLWFNKKLEEVRAARISFKKKQSEKGILSAERRKIKSTEPQPTINQTTTTVEPLESESESEEVLKKNNEPEKFSDDWFREIFDDIHMGNVRATFPKHNIENEFKIFQLKVRGSPDDYRIRDTGGIRNAFNYQLQKSTSTNGNGHHTKTSIRPTVTDDGKGKTFGAWE